MIQLNLLPDIKKEYIKAQRTKRTIITIAFIASGISVAIVFLLFTAVYVVQNQALANINKEVEENIAKLQGIEELDKILTIQNQLSALPQLHEEKPQSERLFEYLSIATPNTVELTESTLSYTGEGIEADVDFEDEGDGEGGSGSIEVTGVANDFKSLNTFVDSLKFATYKAYEKDNDEEPTKNNAFGAVVISSSDKSNAEGEDGGKIDFTVVFTFSSDIFDNKYEKVELTVPNITSSVSSQERPGANKQNEDPFKNDGGQE